MNAKCVGLGVVAFFALGSRSDGLAQPGVQESFNLLFQGDDPSQVFTYDLPFNPLVPSLVRFDGFFENLAPDETGVRYGLRWLRADGSGFDGGLLTDVDGVRLPGVDPVLGPVRVLTQFDQCIAFTPSTVHFDVEGLGPADNFRLVGEFTITPVPEPSVLVLLGGTVIAGWGCRLIRRGRLRKVAGDVACLPQSIQSC
jgi:hypothetical protein